MIHFQSDTNHKHIFAALVLTTFRSVQYDNCLQFMSIRKIKKAVWIEEKGIVKYKILLANQVFLPKCTTISRKNEKKVTLIIIIIFMIVIIFNDLSFSIFYLDEREAG